MAARRALVARTSRSRRQSGDDDQADDRPDPTAPDQWSTAASRPTGHRGRGVSGQGQRQERRVAIGHGGPVGRHRSSMRQRASLDRAGLVSVGADGLCDVARSAPRAVRRRVDADRAPGVWRPLRPGSRPCALSRRISRSLRGRGSRMADQESVVADRDSLGTVADAPARGGACRTSDRPGVQRRAKASIAPAFARHWTASARVLFAMFEGGGNIPLITPVVAAVVDRGADVTVVAGPNIRRVRPGSTVGELPGSARADASHSVVPLLDSPIDPLEARLEAPRSVDAEQPVRCGRRRTNGALVAGVGGPLLRAARCGAPRRRGGRLLPPRRPRRRRARRRPDGHAGAHVEHRLAVTRRAAAATGLVASERPARSCAGSRVGHGARRISRRDGLPSLNAARAGLGLAPLDVPRRQIERADRVLVLASRAFELPHAAARQRPLRRHHPGSGSCLGLGTAAARRTTARARQPQHAAPGQGPIMQRILDAVRGYRSEPSSRWAAAWPMSRSTRPPTCTLETFVPHEAVLPHVAAVVTQCGFSTVTKSLAHGVPLVAIPVLGDQPANAARISALGVGIRLDPDAAAPVIADAIHRIVDESPWRQAAQRFAVTLAAEDPRAAVIDELETDRRQLTPVGRCRRPAPRCAAARRPRVAGEPPWNVRNRAALIRAKVAKLAAVPAPYERSTMTSTSATS